MSNSQTPISGKLVNVAVVGLGFMGATHLRAYLANPRARLVAVCDANRLPTNRVISGVAGNIQQTDEINLGAEVKLFREFAEMLADPDIDLVDLCTPTPLHPGQAMAALRAGKHVLCEKPLARTSVAAREILRVAENSPGFLMPAMCMRFWPGWSWLKQVVTEKTYGEVLQARFYRASAMPAWSQSGTYAGGSDLGGALFDLHIHDTDFVNHLFGRPVKVTSTGILSPVGAINQVATQYHFPNGPVVDAEGSWLLPEGFKMAYMLHCERAMLDYDLARGVDALLITETGKSPRIMSTTGVDGYVAEIRYFMDCVANHRPPQGVTAQDAVTALEICEAEEISVRTGQPSEI